VGSGCGQINVGGKSEWRRNVKAIRGECAGYGQGRTQLAGAMCSTPRRAKKGGGRPEAGGAAHLPQRLVHGGWEACAKEWCPRDLEKGGRENKKNGVRAKNPDQPPRVRVVLTKS